MGTKRTGITDSSRNPSFVRVTRSRLWKLLPTGITRCPPTSSCCFRGSGILGGDTLDLANVIDFAQLDRQLRPAPAVQGQFI